MYDASSEWRYEGVAENRELISIEQQMANLAQKLKLWLGIWKKPKKPCGKKHACA